jgi:hypothetical protein
MSNYERRKALPYGKWTCADGREILFGRSYTPLHQRLASGEVSEADRNEGVSSSSKSGSTPTLPQSKAS